MEEEQERRIHSSLQPYRKYFKLTGENYVKLDFFYKNLIEYCNFCSKYCTSTSDYEKYQTYFDEIEKETQWRFVKYENSFLVKNIHNKIIEEGSVVEVKKSNQRIEKVIITKFVITDEYGFKLYSFTNYVDTNNNSGEIVHLQKFSLYVTGNLIYITKGNTYNIKDILKENYNARWDNNKKQWYIGISHLDSLKNYLLEC